MALQAPDGSDSFGSSTRFEVSGLTSGPPQTKETQLQGELPRSDRDAVVSVRQPTTPSTSDRQPDSAKLTSLWTTQRKEVNRTGISPHDETFDMRDAHV